MKKKNIEILFEAFQRMVKRMKTPLDDKKGEKYVSDLFKKFPDIKKTKILERQLQEMIQEYILLQQIDEIENTPKHVLSLEKPTREPIASSRENSEEYIHFLKHPVQRFIAAIGVLGLGLLLAIPLMQNQIDTPEPSFRESFNEIKSTFKWEGPKMPSLDEALNAQHYSFVLEGEIPEIPQLPAVSFMYQDFPDYGDVTILPTDVKYQYPSDTGEGRNNKILGKVIQFLDSKKIEYSKMNGPYFDSNMGAVCSPDDPKINSDEPCDFYMLNSLSSEAESSVFVYYVELINNYPVYSDESKPPEDLLRTIQVEVSSFTEDILSYNFMEIKKIGEKVVPLRTSEQLKAWIESQDDDVSLSYDYFVMDAVSKKYPITLKAPRINYCVYGPQGKIVEANPCLIFDATGKNDVGEEIAFKQSIPLVGD